MGHQVVYEPALRLARIRACNEWALLAARVALVTLNLREVRWAGEVPIGDVAEMDVESCRLPREGRRGRRVGGWRDEEGQRVRVEQQEGAGGRRTEGGRGVQRRERA